MGDCLSKETVGRETQHELLPDDDASLQADEYFAKVQKRNQTVLNDTDIPEQGGVEMGGGSRANMAFSTKSASVSRMGNTTGGGDAMIVAVRRHSGGANGSLLTSPSELGAAQLPITSQLTGIAGDGGVRDRAAMLEQAEADALNTSRNYNAAAMMPSVGKSKFNLVISPTASANAGGGGVAGLGPAREEYPSLTDVRSRSGGGGAGATSGVRALPASKKDTAGMLTSSAVGSLGSGSGGGGGGGRDKNALSSSIRSGASGGGGTIDDFVQRSRAGARTKSGDDDEEELSTTLDDCIMDYMTGPQPDNTSLVGSDNGFSQVGGKRVSSGLDRGGDIRRTQNPSQRLSNVRATFDDTMMMSNALVYTEIVRGDRISAVAWEPGLVGGNGNASMIAIGTDDGHVAILDVDEQHAIQERDGSLGKLVRGSDGTMRRLPSTRGGVTSSLGIRELPPREGKIRSLCWSPVTPYHLCIGGDDCTAIVVDTRTMDPIGEVEREDRVYSAIYNPAGTYIAIGGFDGIVAVINATTMDIVTEVRRSGLVLSLSWNHNGSLLAVGGSDKLATVIETERFMIVGEIQRPASVQCVRWHPLDPRDAAATSADGDEEGSKADRGQLLAVGGNDGVVAVVDIDARRILQDIPLASGDDTPAAPALNTEHRINDIVWSPDGMFLAIVGTDGIVKIVETTSFVSVQELTRGKEVNVSCIDWQNTGKYLAVGGEDKATAILKTGGMMGQDGDDEEEQRARDAAIGNGVGVGGGGTEWTLNNDDFDDRYGGDVENSGSKTKNRLSSSHRQNQGGSGTHLMRGDDHDGDDDDSYGGYGGEDDGMFSSPDPKSSADDDSSF